MPSKTTGGWIIFIAALGTILGMLGAEIGQLTAWDGAMTPAFVGKSFVHVGAVIAAFTGGKLIPSQD